MSTPEFPPKDRTSPDTPWEADAPGDAARARYILKLYVAGLTPRSISALRSVKDICERHLQGRYELEIIDIYEHPSLAKDQQIIAAPTLIKQLPLPLRRLIGDMADQERVLVGLDLRLKDTGGHPPT